MLAAQCAAIARRIGMGLGKADIQYRRSNHAKYMLLQAFSFSMLLVCVWRHYKTELTKQNQDAIVMLIESDMRLLSRIDERGCDNTVEFVDKKLANRLLRFGTTLATHPGKDYFLWYAATHINRKYTNTFSVLDKLGAETNTPPPASKVYHFN